MATVFSGPSEEQKKIFASHGRNLDGSKIRARQTTGGSGGKGGSKPSYDPQTEGDLLQRAQAKYNTDNSYGYYNDQGQYVDFFTDATDGGGMNTTGTFFKGGGPISTLGNVMKIRPAGMSREMKDGQYVIPREQIGFRDITDMTDRGGPQAMGGEYQGGPMFVSNIFNALDKIGGVDQGERVAYADLTPEQLEERRRALRGY